MTTPTGLAVTDDGRLRCPSCGGDSVHVPSVTIAAAGRAGSVTVTAAGEDDDGRLSLALPGGPVANPGSSRRWAITLHLDCELCAAGTDVTLAQHKGQTDVQVGVRPPIVEQDSTRTRRLSVAPPPP